MDLTLKINNPIFFIKNDKNLNKADGDTLLQSTCSTSTDLLLISSDNFVNCNKVRVVKGKNNNYLIVSERVWVAAKTYKIEVRRSGGEILQMRLNDSTNPASFKVEQLGVVDTVNYSLYIGDFPFGVAPEKSMFLLRSWKLIFGFLVLISVLLKKI